MTTTTPAWALVTGASGGIGKEFAVQLAAQGWNLVLASRGLDKLEKLRTELLASHPTIKIEVVGADLAASGGASKLHADCAARGLAVDLLVNNAGAGMFGELVACDPATIESMLQLNVQALTTLCILFGRDMAARGAGAILNVGSFAGNQATPYFAPYAASKSYVRNLSLAMRAELAPKGVKVVCLQPGYVATAFDANAGIASPKYLKFSESNSLGPEAVARAGLKALRRNKAWHIPGFQNKIGAFFFGLMPVTWPPAIMRRVLDGMR